MVEKVTLGFWLYLMSDCLLFASLVAVYAILHTQTFSGPEPIDIFSLPYVLTETCILLTSSFTCGLMLLGLSARNVRLALAALGATGLLGAAFLGLELTEFRSLILEGHGPSVSAFLSSFFTLVGTHGLHIAFGLVWLLVLCVHLYKNGLTEGTERKLACFALFWHFLDLIWIFIFTFVYLFGFL